MKLLGLIGGTSWHSTIEYYKLINEIGGERMGQDQNPPMLIYSFISLLRLTVFAGYNLSGSRRSRIAENLCLSSLLHFSVFA